MHFKYVIRNFLFLFFYFPSCSMKYMFSLFPPFLAFHFLHYHFFFTMIHDIFCKPRKQKKNHILYKIFFNKIQDKKKNLRLVLSKLLGKKTAKEVSIDFGVDNIFVIFFFCFIVFYIAIPIFVFIIIY
mgnify:CR=1 FL=1